MPKGIFERSIDKVHRLLKPKTLSVYAISGRVADGVGSIVLQEVARHLDQPLVVIGKSKHHSGRIYGKKLA